LNKKEKGEERVTQMGIGGMKEIVKANSQDEENIWQREGRGVFTSRN